MTIDNNIISACRGTTPHVAHEGGTRTRWEFPNGYGASVIRTPHSYGGWKGLFELAVTRNGELCYTTPITSDVLGFLTEQEVLDTLAKINALPDAVA